MQPMPATYDLRQAALRIGRVSLKVRDLQKVADFYATTLGLRRLASDPGRVVLGSAKAALLELMHDPAAAPRDPRAAGLFHIAFMLPSRASLGAWLAHVIKNRLPLQGASDHLVSEAIYLADPEGNGIEVYADSPVSGWHDASGKLRMATKPLDGDAVLAAAAGSAWAGFPDDGLIGHIHLQVGDTAASEHFYRDILGFDLTTRYPQASFFGSDGYHHQLACNSSNSAGSGMRPIGAAGLAGFEILLPSAEHRAAILQRAAQAGVACDQAGESFSLHDPWGSRISLALA